MSTRRLSAFALIVFAVFSFLFILLRSNDPLATDGPFRSLEVYRRHTLFFHSGNHLLYPVNVFAWTHLAVAVGFHTDNPESFLSAVAVMNCIAGAGCLALFFLITSVASQSWQFGVVTTVIYGLSKAFLVHATNASEPMVGVFWSFLAMTVAIVAIRRNSAFFAAVTGFLFALSLTTYQSTVLLGPAALFLIWTCSRVTKDLNPTAQNRVTPRSGFALAVFFGLGAAIGSASIYAWAARTYWNQRPAGTTFQMVAAHLFEPVDTHAFFGVTLAKLANVPVGLVSNVFPILNDFTGLRNLLHGPVAPFLRLAFFLFATGTLFVFCAAGVLKTWNASSEKFRRSIVAAILGLAFTLFPVVTFSQGYDKLWLQPLACIFFGLAVSLHSISQNKTDTKYLISGLSVLVLAGVVSNITVLRGIRRPGYPEMTEAQRLSRMVQENDLVVGDWDAISVLYSYAWARDGQFFSFTSNAASFGDQAASNLRHAIFKTQRAGGRVYFLSILDLSRTSWDSFLGSRCGVDYSQLDFYRQHSVLRATFQTRYREVALKQLVASF